MRSSTMKGFIIHFIGLVLLCSILPGSHAQLIRRQKFVLTDTSYTRLCTTKNILTVNGQFPGPTLYANVGDTIVVDVYNNATENVTIHWHGVKQPRYPWSDGPEYVTQCPIRPGTKFSQKIVLSDEIGTLWWHAHSEWSRATVHGHIIVRPRKGERYPFKKPDAEVPIMLAEWWNRDIKEVLEDFLRSGEDPIDSDAFLINGQPGDFYNTTNCSRPDTYKLRVESGKTYLMRMVNGVMNNIMFFSVANHNVTIVGSDGAYLKPFKSDYITISPGQTIDFLLEANQQPGHYYMTSRAYDARGANFPNTTTSGIIEYIGNYTPPSSPLLPSLPGFTATNASTNFTGRFRSLASKDHPIDVPQNATTKLLYTLSINVFPCPDDSCEGPGGGRLAASVNNISFVNPGIDILQAYYKRTRNVYGDDFPDNPPFTFNYTGDNLPQVYWLPRNETQVNVIDYDSTVELVFQGTNLVAGIDHPMHLHGYSFYVVGWGIGNFDRERDPLNYNLVDPPLMNTIAVPINGWTAIRFKADNPGVWFMHCHLERHVSWGMGTVFIVKDGKRPNARMLPPPPDMPRC